MAEISAPGLIPTTPVSSSKLLGVAPNGEFSSYLASALPISNDTANLIRFASGPHPSEAPWNADPTGVAPASTALNAFYAAVAATDYGSARHDGIWNVDAAINIGPATGKAATKNFVGKPLYFGSAAIADLVTIRNADFCQFGYMQVWGQGYVDGGTVYSGRTCTNGLVLRKTNTARFEGIDVRTFLGDGIFVDGGSGNFTYYNDLGNVYTYDIGSCAVTNFQVAATWNTKVNSGSSGSYDQYSTITVSTLPPASCDSLPKLVVIGGVVYGVQSINRGASTIRVFPTIDTGLASGTLQYIYGSAMRVSGTDAADNVAGHISAFRCGIGLSFESIYGMSVNNLTTQFCGAGVVSGYIEDSAMLGGQVGKSYYEGNTFDIVAKTNAAQGLYLTAVEPIELAKVVSCNAPRNTTTNAISIDYGGLRGIFIGNKDGLNTFQKGRLNSEIGLGYATLDLGQSLSGKITRYQEPPFAAFGFQVFTDLGTAVGLNNTFGYDSFETVVLGVGPNGSPTGTIVFYAPSGWTVNGGASASFLAPHPGPVTLTGYMNFTTLNIIMGVKSELSKEGNATLVGGTITIADTAVTANSLVHLTRKTIGGTVGNLTYTISPGVSFTINSSSGTDASIITYKRTR